MRGLAPLLLLLAACSSAPEPTRTFTLGTCDRGNIAVARSEVEVLDLEDGTLLASGRTGADGRCRLQLPIRGRRVAFSILREGYEPRVHRFTLWSDDCLSITLFERNPPRRDREEAPRRP